VAPAGYAAKEGDSGSGLVAPPVEAGGCAAAAIRTAGSSPGSGRSKKQQRSGIGY